MVAARVVARTRALLDVLAGVRTVAARVVVVAAAAAAVHPVPEPMGVAGLEIRAAAAVVVLLTWRALMASLMDTVAAAVVVRPLELERLAALAA